MRLTHFFPLAVVLALGGCGTTDSASAPLIADVRSPIADVPVPAGFSMASTSTSKMVAESGLRTVNHFYTGHDNFLAVANFYRDKMPQKGWVWTGQTQPTGKQVIEHFSKKAEICTVTVDSRLFDTMIHIEIGPPPQ
jgi:hypothetical protein